MAKPRAGSALPAVIGGLYLGLAFIAFVYMFLDGSLDDFSGWVPALVVSQGLFVALVGVTPRPRARTGVRAALAAILAALLVLVAGAGIVGAPLEILEKSTEDLAIGLGIAGLVVVAVAVLVCVVRFARLLAPASARGVAAVLGVVMLTGIWAGVTGVICYLETPNPHALLAGLIAMMAAFAGGLSVAWALPLWLLAWHLAGRQATEVTPAGGVS
jgi:hypothetical protein